MLIKLIIPPKELIVQTNSGDPALFHYKILTSYFYRKRLKNTFSLMEKFRFNQLLEIGYGSGILLPSLSKLARAVTALDIHSRTKVVQKLLDFYKVNNVNLTVGSVFKMPFKDHAFDGCVIVSTLEDIEDSEKAIKEIKRVLKKRAKLFVSFPVKNKFSDILFQLLGENADKIHPSNHNSILISLQNYFTIKQIIKYPSFMPVDSSLYLSLFCVNDTT